jgi:hypothetical protein
MRRGRHSTWVAAERLISLLMAFGLGYVVLGSPYIGSAAALAVSLCLVGGGAVARLYLSSIAKRSSRGTQ